MTVAELIQELKKMPSGKKVLLFMHLPNQDEGMMHDLVEEVFEKDQQFVVLRSKHSLTKEESNEYAFYCNCAFPVRDQKTDSCLECGGTLC
jgi:hypothetical protein